MILILYAPHIVGILAGIVLHDPDGNVVLTCRPVTGQVGDCPRVKDVFDSPGFAITRPGKAHGV
jgi:hypothetical protein